MTLREITISKLQNLSDPLLHEVSQFIDKLQEKQLSEAAKNAINDYQNDSELNVFRILDGEDFYEEESYA